MTSLRWLPALLLTLAACAAPSPPPPPAIPIAPASPAAPPAPPPPDPLLASVIATPRPPAFRLDGDLTEWGDLLPPPPPPTDPRKPGAPDPNPRDAPSHVALALSAEGLHLAAALAEPARDGLWLGLGVEPPPTLPVGEYQRGGGVLPFSECSPTPDTPDDAPDPESSPACVQLRRHVADKIDEHDKRFRHVYRLDREGLRVLDDKGALAPVPGAQLVIKPGPQGATLEAFLPLRALPRMSEAPVTALLVGARAAKMPVTELPAPETWAVVGLPEPLGFEPWAALRAAVYQSERGNLYPAGLSYHPAEPLRIESLRYPGLYYTRDYEVRDGVLYTRRATQGDIEVGVVQSRSDLIAVFHEGALVEVHRPWNIDEIRERDGEIHVIGYTEYTGTDDWVTGAGWGVLAIGPGGAPRDNVIDEPKGIVSWVAPRELHTPDYSTLGVRGGAHLNRDEKVVGLERTWRWDKAKRRYLLKERRVPLPPRKKEKKRP